MLYCIETALEDQVNILQHCITFYKSTSNYLGHILQVFFLNIKFETKCILLMSAVRLFGIRSMPVVDVIIQVTWHPV